jgi:hypothetical protein
MTTNTNKVTIAKSKIKKLKKEKKVPELLTESIGIAEALSILSSKPNEYSVISQNEKFMGKQVISFYLKKNDDPKYKKWIVYPDLQEYNIRHNH